MRKLRFHCLLWLALLIPVLPTLCAAQISVGLSVNIGPPPLPVYPQPVCPAPGYIWTPGYWAYGPDGYYWVPGTWVVAPTAGVLWTPGYWGWVNGAYIWNGGYWGPHVGFYGGVNYGYGYGGVGFVGGRWDHGVFAYNSAVTNVNVTVIHTTYIDRTVVNNVTVNRVSFNGGPGGLAVRPTAAEEAALHERHMAATAEQIQHEHAASSNRALLASVNHGRPSIAATSKAGRFDGRGAVAARGSTPRPQQNAMRNNNVPRPPSSAPRSDAMAAQRNNGSPHGGGAAHSDGRYQPVSRSHQAEGGQQRGGGEHHQGGERPH